MTLFPSHTAFTLPCSEDEVVFMVFEKSDLVARHAKTAHRSPAAIASTTGCSNRVVGCDFPVF